MLDPLRNAELVSPRVERVGRGPLAVAPLPDPQPARATSGAVSSGAAAIAISQRMAATLTRSHGDLLHLKARA